MALESSRDTQKRSYDKKVSSFKPFAPNELVLLTNEASVPNRAKKLLPKYVGPFVVLEKLSDLNYKIGLIGDPSTNKVVHYNRLIRYVCRNIAEKSHQTNLTTEKSKTLEQSLGSGNVALGLLDLLYDDFFYPEVEVVTNVQVIGNVHENVNENTGEVNIERSIETNLALQTLANTNIQISNNAQTSSEREKENSNNDNDNLNLNILEQTDVEHDSDINQKPTLSFNKCGKQYTSQLWLNKHKCS